ncbi:hypothetical protein BpHYR1_053916 [Brachionus plicatilis]|uniref:Uncharacterized protein n=1 Tax=Brachionus plicatilis TaxID=10195 RepID=A0A3M7QC87_BRAPC|nr:hypothetical protein BpHYR1_053916 [Brachionus plicatilis]
MIEIKYFFNFIEKHYRKLDRSDFIIDISKKLEGKIWLRYEQKTKYKNIVLIQNVQYTDIQDELIITFFYGFLMIFDEQSNI